MDTGERRRSTDGPLPVDDARTLLAEIRTRYQALPVRPPRGPWLETTRQAMAAIAIRSRAFVALPGQAMRIVLEMTASGETDGSQRRRRGPTMIVKATREGLVGQKTASGWIITPWVPAVALPSIAALHLPVLVTNPLNGKCCKAWVLDVGPHHTGDDAHVFGGHRPQAESDPGSNGAGIDLSEAVWNALGMTDNTEVEWTFL